MVCFQRVWSLAIETLQRALSLAAGRQRQDQILPALGASWSFSLAHAIFLKPGNSNCLFGPGLRTRQYFCGPVERCGKTAKGPLNRTVERKGAIPTARTRGPAQGQPDLFTGSGPKESFYNPLKSLEYFALGGGS